MLQRRCTNWTWAFSLFLALTLQGQQEQQQQGDGPAPPVDAPAEMLRSLRSITTLPLCPAPHICAQRAVKKKRGERKKNFPPTSHQSSGRTEVGKNNKSVSVSKKGNKTAAGGETSRFRHLHENVLWLGFFCLFFGRFTSRVHLGRSRVIDNQLDDQLWLFNVSKENSASSRSLSPGC